jgi:RNA-directed DNA polymerase
LRSARLHQESWLIAWSGIIPRASGLNSTAEGYYPQPLRRIYILKSDRKTMRPLGIPSMIDRVMQALHLLALDPVADTNADRNSYGFWQQRSCADAIQQCFNALMDANTQWNIRSCFR